ncbi:MAG TPA: hypothetical protein VGM50_16935 [Gemmatimonadaceae bacterium]|jgi:uncharacterized membrane protein
MQTANDVHTDNPLRKHPVAATILLAGATGARGMLGIAATSRVVARAHDEPAQQPARVMAQPRTLAATTAFAAMELAGDTIPGIPNRIDPGPIVTRALSGALIGATIGELTGRNRMTTALIGAVSAFVGAHLTFRLRRRLMEVLPSVPAAMIEDAIVVGIASVGVAALDEAR